MAMLFICYLWKPGARNLFITSLPQRDIHKDTSRGACKDVITYYCIFTSELAPQWQKQPQQIAQSPYSLGHKPAFFLIVVAVT